MSPERNVLQSRQKEACEILRPSLELAWMLGVLSGAGHVATDGKIRLITRNSELLKEFTIVGQRLFGKEPHAGKSNTISFYSKPIVREIGDLKNDAWVETIQQKHRWVLDERNLTWKFIEGIFDAKAHLRKKMAESFALFFMTTNFTNAVFIKNLLLGVGIQKPTISLDEEPTESDDIHTLYTIGVYGIKDLKLIAENIHPKSPEKQDKLKAIKESPSPVTREQLLDEYMRLFELLGHFPSSFELEKLYREGETPFSRFVYERKLGQGSFTKAKKTMLLEYSRITKLAGPSFEAAQKLTDYLKSKSKELAKYGISEEDIQRHNAQIKEECDKILLATSEKEVNQAVESLDLLLSRIQRKISIMTPLSVIKGRLRLQGDIP